MGNRSKAEWMSCFARSPSLNGFQGWVRLCMCCLAGCVCVCVCVCERLSVFMCVICMYMQIYVCAPECLCACVPASLLQCLCFYPSAKCTLEFLQRLLIKCSYKTSVGAVKPYSYCLTCFLIWVETGSCSRSGLPEVLSDSQRYC